jgi:hypothetical protein
MIMKLYILRPVAESDPRHKWPWRAQYDTRLGFIVRAESLEAARWIAAANHWDEGSEAWLSDLFSTCEELTAEGEASVVMVDSNPG